MASLRRRTLVFAAAWVMAATVALPARAQTPAAGPSGPTSVPFWTGISDAASFERAMNARLAHAQTLLDKLLAGTGARTIVNTLRPYDDVLLELDAVGSQAQLVQSVHPSEPV